MQTLDKMKSDILARATSDNDFRARMLADPRSAAQEVTGIEVPDKLTIKVHEDTETCYHIALGRQNPMGESQLGDVAGGGGHNKIW